MIEIGTSIPHISSFPQPRNFKRADCKNFCTNLDKCLGLIPPTTENYQRFTKAVTDTTKIQFLKNTAKNTYQGATIIAKNYTAFEMFVFKYMLSV